MKFCCSASTMQRRNRSSRLSFCAVAARCSNSFLAASGASFETGPGGAENGRKTVDSCKGVKSAKAEIYIQHKILAVFTKKEKSQTSVLPTYLRNTKFSHTNATSRSRSCRKSISACSSSCPFTPHLHQNHELCNSKENPENPPPTCCTNGFSQLRGIAAVQGTPKGGDLRKVFRGVGPWNGGGIAWDLFIYSQSIHIFWHFSKRNKNPKVQTLVFLAHVMCSLIQTFLIDLQS